MVKEGYKEANIGPLDYKIPVNWDIDYISDIESLELLSSGINNFKGEKKYLSTSSIERNKIIEIEELIEYKQRPSRANMQPVIDSVWFAKMKDTVKVYSYIEKNKNEIKEYIMSTGFIGIKCKENISVEFLNQYFLWNQFNKIKNVYSHGSTQQAVNMKDVRNLKLIIPPLPEQQKIASILSSVDKSIEKTDEVIEETKELKKGLMQDLFTKGIGHSKFKESKIKGNTFSIPNNWEIEKFGKYIMTLTDYHANGSYKILKKNVELFDNEDYAIMLRTTNFEQNKFNKNDFKYIDKSAYNFLKKSKVKPGDILMNKIGSPGNIYYVPFIDKPMSVGMNLFLIRTNELLTHKYVYYYLDYSNQYVKSFTSGSTTKTINKKAVRNLKIILPPLEEQKKIASILSSVDSKIKKEEEYKAKLERLKKGLMQKLLTGEIRVNTEMEV